MTGTGFLNKTVAQRDQQQLWSAGMQLQFPAGTMGKGSDPWLGNSRYRALRATPELHYPLPLLPSLAYVIPERRESWDHAINGTSLSRDKLRPACAGSLPLKAAAAITRSAACSEVVLAGRRCSAD